ncbi:MAG: Fic family protein, partial [Betaproteobacteria bacterium]|nr:Fic family protein [Betaproteobacteria bacterium]
FTNPYVTVARAAVLLNVSNPTARKAVELLVAKGVLESLGEKRWGKVYLCRAILDAIELE